MYRSRVVTRQNCTGMFGSNDRGTIGKVTYSCHCVYNLMDDQSSVITHNYYYNNDRVDQ